MQWNKLCLSILLCLTAAVYGDQIQWESNYALAFEKAKNTNKPIFIFFTSSDGCAWCNQLEEEAINTPEFINELASIMIFFKVDSPMYRKLPTEVEAQNKQLIAQYGVHSYPTIILVDASHGLMGMTGYRAGGGREYAHHMNKILSDYAEYRQKMEQLAAQPLKGKELKRLYQTAHSLGLSQDCNQILQEGIHSDHARFFMIESYRLLVADGKIEDTKTRSLREQLLASDGDKIVHYQLALIDFEAHCKGAKDADGAVAPLVAYIQRFGKDDRENLWRLNMVIAQMYLDKGNLEKALEFAQQSYEAAPAAMQQNIGAIIKDIRSRGAGQ